MEILKVKNLNVLIDKNLVLDDLNFTVDKNDFLIIIGPNGAGKTTLLRALLNLIKYKGQITWHEDNISYLPNRDLINRNLSNLTVNDFFSLKNSRHKKVLDLLTELELDKEILSKQLQILSTGQFQRVLIAWVFSTDFNIILLDEPSTGLDLQGQKIIFELLSQKVCQGKTVIAVTHHIDFAWKYATKVLGINKKQFYFNTPNKLNIDDVKKIYQL